MSSTPQNSLRSIILMGVAALQFFAQAWAQNPDSPTQTPRQGGGGVGFGISIDIGSVINAVRNRQNRDTDSEVDRSAVDQQPFTRPPISLEQLKLQLKADKARNITRQALRTGMSERAGMKLAPQSESCALNGNFEQANLGQWAGADNGGLSRNNSSRWNITTLGINSGALNADNSHQNLVGPGNDPTLGVLMQQVRPGGGSSSVRIGNTAVNYGSELLAKSFKVSAANAIVGFSYAVVMQNPTGHSPSDQPSLAVRVLDASGNDITNNIAGGRVKLSPGSATPNVLIADAANPFFKTFGSGAGGPIGGGEVVVYKDWACSEINLSDLVGQDVTIEFITIDCGAGGHWGYAYVDDFCTSCGPGPEGAIQAAPSDECGIGKICVDVTVPKAGSQTGQATVSLDIWQNGIKVTTLNQPAINTDGKVCFPINPSGIAGLDLTRGFDYSVKADLKIGTVVLSPKSLGSGPNGVKPDSNNDYLLVCSVGGQCGTQGQPPCPVCGQEGQPPCPTCGQPGQPLCQEICTPANPSGAGGNTPRANTGMTNRLGNFLGSLRSAATGTPGKPAALEKKAVAVGSSVNGNYTINWVVSYANTSNQALTDVLVVDGPIATIIFGSLQQPAGWMGTTNTNDTYAKWTGAIVPPHGVMTQTFLTPGPTSFNTTSGTADGYQPIMYQHSSGPRAYWIAHHHSAMGCFDLKTGNNCAGTWPKNTPIGDGSANWSRSTLNNSEYFIQSGKLYYSVNHIPSQKSGVGCYDLEADTQCGFTQLTPKPSEGLNTPAAIFGPWLVGTEAYMASANGDLFCVKYPALIPCTGTSYRIADTVVKLNVSSVNFSDSDTVAVAGHIAGKVVGTKLYLTSLKGATKSTASKFVNCFDAVTKQACWSGALPTKGTAAHSYSNAPNKYWGNISNFLYFNTSGLAQAICTRSASKQDCVELSSGNLINLPKVLGSTNLDVGLEAHLWPKTYFVAATHFGNGAIDAKALCWDWISGGYCNGSNDYVISQAPTTNTEDYGAAVDENGCVWVLGHLQKLWNFDPNNLDANKKAQRCGGATGKAQLTFQPLQYCSGPKPFKWTAVEIKGTTLANMDKLIVKVLDATTNAVLFTKDLKAGGALSTPITSVNAQTESKPLKIELEYTPKAGTNDQPYVEVRYDAPALEFCFTSKHTCAQGDITNKVETQDPQNLNNIISASATVAKAADCPCISCGTANTPSCATCGQAGQPVCPPCGQLGQPPCCGGVGQPPCTSCGGIGQAPCDGGPKCIPGTPGCPIITIGDPICIPGTPGCPILRPPPPSGVCLTGNCEIDKPKQSVAEEFKEPKVSCVRKPKETEEVKKPSPPKPKPKPAVVNPAPKPVVEADAKPAAPKPAPKPRPKPAPKPKAQDDDDC